MDDGDVRAGAEKIERGFSCGIPASDDYDFLIPVRVRLGEIVRDVREVFAGNPKVIRMIVKSRGYYDFSCAVLLRLPKAIGGVHSEGVVAACDAVHFFVLMNFDFEMFDGAPVIFQSFGASGLEVGDGHRQVADFHAFGRGEKSHVGRIVEQRVTEAAFIEDKRGEALEFGFDGTGQAGGAGANADDVV